MRIRTLTTFVSLPPASSPNSRAEWVRLLRDAAAFNEHGKKKLEQAGYEVQTTRITTNPFPEFTSTEDCVMICQILDNICMDAGVRMLSVGPTSSPSYIEKIPEIISFTERVSCSVAIPSRPNGIVDLKTATHAAAATLAISRIDPVGAANFRFCTTANVAPGTPFFPVGYSPSWPGEAREKGDGMSFALGLECSDLVVRAFKETRAKEEGVAQAEEDNDESVLDVAERFLKKIMNTECIHVERTALEFAQSFDIKYTGIDVSIAPSCGAIGLPDSIATAYEHLGLGGFGNAGTLTVSALVTGVVKRLDVTKCGYSGLMMPIMEDAGLAERFAKRAFSVQEVLLYSSVCGCGLDCVPIAGDTPVNLLANLLADMATLAFKLDKPLSARIFPIPGAAAGDFTQFNDPLLVNTRVVGLV